MLRLTTPLKGLQFFTRIANCFYLYVLTHFKRFVQRDLNFKGIQITGSQGYTYTFFNVQLWKNCKFKMFEMSAVFKKFVLK